MVWSGVKLGRRAALRRRVSVDNWNVPGYDSSMSTIPDSTLASLREGLKSTLVRELGLDHVVPEMIENDDPLFGEGGLGLDSLDAVELVVILQRVYCVEITDVEKAKEIFASIDTLAHYIIDYRARVS